MKKTVLTLALAIAVVSAPAVGRAQDAPPPPQDQERAPAEPAGRVIDTPFGQVEVDRGGVDPAAPPAAEPVAPVEEIAPAGGAAAAVAEEAVQPAQDDLAGVELQFTNVDIYDVIAIIGDELELNYVIDPTVQGVVNISTSSTLRRTDLLPILETILSINGATMIQTGNFYRIVPAVGAERQPLVVQDDALPVAPGDQMAMQIVRMRYVTATEMASLLTPYLGEGGNITAHSGGNILIVTERRSNLRKLLDIIAIFDSDTFEGERVRLLPVENGFAGSVALDLERVFAGYARSQTTAIQFVPIERLNSILVVTPNPSVFPEVERWLTRLDQAGRFQSSGGLQNFVYRVRNGKAADIQRVLAELYGVSVSGGPQGAQPQFTQPIGQNLGIATGGQAAAGQAPPPPAVDGQAQGTSTVIAGNIRIIADEVNNFLVVQSTAEDYAVIEQTIMELDVLPRQVLVDMQIYEVNLDDSLSFGLSAALQNRGTLQNPLTTVSFASEGGGPPSLAAQTFGFIGRSRELVAFLNASENRSRVRTLSAPSVLVSDNMTAQFQVGAEVPIPTSSSVTPVQADGTNLFAQTISFRTTGVLMQVRPQINDGGQVTLEITQEVSAAGANTTSAIVAPVIGTSAVSSTIVIQDGQTIALGGFIRENQENATSRVPIIGRIPGLGALFGNTRRSSTRSELVVLITPHVIQGSEDNIRATEELKSKLVEVQQMLQ